MIRLVVWVGMYELFWEFPEKIEKELVTGKLNGCRTDDRNLMRM